MSCTETSQTTRPPCLKPNFTSEPSIFPLDLLILHTITEGSRGEDDVINAAVGERIAKLQALCSRVTLSPMDRNARMYESYLWESEKKSYLRHAVLFGFFVQLNHIYTNTEETSY